jgi:AP-1 complex subunit mu
LTLIFSFLHKVVDILIEYFNLLEEESIRDNFVLIYELLDEIIDHGYPQTTETKVLKEYIKTESNKIKISSKNAIPANTGALYGKISWRPEGIKYKTNNAFLDVVEKVNSLVLNFNFIFK